MPRYHFNVYDGVSDVDRDGTDLPDWPTARVAAIRLAGEIFRDDAKGTVLDEDWRMEVTDDRGSILFRLDFSGREAAALSGHAGFPRTALTPLG